MSHSNQHKTSPDSRYDAPFLTDNHFEASKLDNPKLQSFKFSLKWLLVVITMCAFVAAFLTIGFREADRVHSRNQLLSGFRSSYMAICNFESARRCLPATSLRDENGVELSSWRFQILPYWGVGHLGRQYWNSPWNAPINRSNLNWMPIPFGVGATSNRFTTNIFAIGGVDTAFENRDYPGLSKRKFDELPSSLVILMETSQSTIHWMQPGDYDVDELLAANGRLSDKVKGVLFDRVHVTFSDGEVWALSPDMPMTALHPFLTITGAKNADRDEFLASFRIE